jgi:hypothetical protein
MGFSLFNQWAGWQSLIFDWPYKGKEIGILALDFDDVEWRMMETFFSSSKLRRLIIVAETTGFRDCVFLEFDRLFRKYWTQGYDARFYFVDRKVSEFGDLSFLKGDSI